MQKDNLACDPRGLISDAYRIDGISLEECRSIFLDWAIGVPDGENVIEHISLIYAQYSAQFTKHPMTSILYDGINLEVEPRQSRKRRY